MRMILLHTEGELADSIREITQSYWSHIGVMLNNNQFFDFSHDEKKIATINDLVEEYQIIDDGRYNHEVYCDVQHNYNVAKYDVKSIIKLNNKLKEGGRDNDNIQNAQTHFNCANLISHAYVNNPPLKHQKYHWSQATPEDFWRMFGE